MPRKLSSEEARRIGRIGGLVTWSRRPAQAAEQLADARDAQQQQFPNRSARRLFYLRLAESGRAAKAAKRAAE